MRSIGGELSLLAAEIYYGLPLPINDQDTGVLGVILRISKFALQEPGTWLRRARAEPISPALLQDLCGRC